MFVDIKVADLEAIKRDIAHHTPHASASHRAEAMARGFGFGTYAALRSALATGPVRVPVHASAFSRFLSERGCSTTEFGPKHHAGSLTPLHLAVLALWIRPVLEGHPHLNRNGLAPIRFGEWDKGFWTPRRLAAMCASPEGKERLAADRTAMLSASALAEFGRCMEFLSRTHRLKQATAKSRDSYGLKHAVERWWRGHRSQATGADGYVANGMFIVAAMHLGFPVKLQEWSSPNCFFGVAQKSLDRLDPNEAKFFQMRGRRAHALPGDLTPTSEWMVVFPDADRAVMAA